MRVIAIAVIGGILLTGCANQQALSPWLDVGTQVARNMGYGQSADMVAGIRQILDVSGLRATSALSAVGGYKATGNALSLPDGLQPVARALKTVGLGSYVTQMENAMNRGAEKAAAEALPVFKQAIREMSVTDALGIVSGGNSAATDYFRKQTENNLRARYQPILKSSLESTGFYSQYKTVLDTYNKLPLTNKPNIDIEAQLLNQSMNALFSRMAEEEKLIRANPTARGSELIGAVFSKKAN